MFPTILWLTVALTDMGAHPHTPPNTHLLRGTSRYISIEIFSNIMISQHQYFPISLYLNTNILQYHLIQCVTDVPCCGCTRSRLIYAENSCGHCASIIVNCSVHNIQDALFIQSNTMNFVMNKARKYKVFETQASAALFGLGCVSLCGCSPPQIWSSGPRAK